MIKYPHPTLPRMGRTLWVSPDAGEMPKAKGDLKQWQYGNHQ